MKSERVSIFVNASSDRSYRASTGLSKEDFLNLAEKFSRYYQPTVLVGYPEGFGNESIFQSPSEALYFLLYSHKTSLSYDVLGINFGMSRSAAHHAEQLLKPILKSILRDEGTLPKRIFFSVEEMEAYFNGVDALLIDATEIPTQRPGNEEEQKEKYSKKNINTASKNTLISGKDKRIYFLGKTVSGGKTHDYSLFKKEFPPEENWFVNQVLFVDLGYQGIKKDYRSKNTDIPFKKPRRSKKNPTPELTPAEKEYNQYVGSNRIYVENALAGLKRYQKISVKYRGKSVDKLDESIELCAGLWNYTLDRKSKKTACKPLNNS